MTSKPWVKKYEPCDPSDIVGQGRALAELEAFITSGKAQRKKAALLVGPVGCGKTSAVLVLAKKHHADVIEVNASDSRNAAEIELRIGEACRQRSLFFQQKIILVDEIDGIAGQQDRGGIASLAKIMESSAFPLVLTANDVEDAKFSPLKKASRIIGFDPVPAEAVMGVLRRISTAECLTVEEMALARVAYRCRGDLRAAINDVQALAVQSKSVTAKQVAHLDERNTVEKMQDALIKIFKVADAAIAGSALDGVGCDMDECLLWIEENLPKEYEDPRALARACECLSRADVFRGRIRRWQHWRFLVYVNALMTVGVALAKDKRKREPVPYGRSRRLLSIYVLKLRHAKKRSIAEKIAKKTHASVRRTLKDTMPFVIKACRRHQGLADHLAAWAGLDEEEKSMWCRQGR